MAKLIHQVLAWVKDPVITEQVVPDPKEQTFLHLVWAEVMPLKGFPELPVQPSWCPDNSPVHPCSSSVTMFKFHTPSTSDKYFAQDVLFQRVPTITR